MLRDATLLRLGKRNALRYADPWSPDRKRAAGLNPGSPGLRRVRRGGRKAAGGTAGAPRWRNDGGDFYLQNHAQVSISEVPGPGSRPRGLPAAPPPPPACHFDGKTQHFGDTGRHFPDSVENSDIY